MEAPLRIGIDGRPARIGRGGIAVYARELLAAWARRFPDDRVRAYDLRWRGGRGASAPGGPWRAWPVPSRVAEVAARWGAGADLWLGGCDVLHLTDYAWLEATRAAVVATVHDVLFAEMPAAYTPGMRRGLARFVRRAVVRADRLLVPSARTRDALVARFSADPGRVDLVPLAPRTLPAAEPARAPRPYFLAVGTLEPRKNLARVLAAHARLRARGACADLVVAGARGWLDGALADALSLAPGVRWEGAVGDDRLASLYRGALAFLYPSLAEGYGLPVAEALALGVPVMTSAGTACGDLAGDAALLVDPRDDAAIERALERLASDEALRRDLAVRGRARAAAWSWEAVAEATRAAYLRAVEDRRARRRRPARARRCPTRAS